MWYMEKYTCIILHMSQHMEYACNVQDNIHDIHKALYMYYMKYYTFIAQRNM
jgi:hypothetical protein